MRGRGRLSRIFILVSGFLGPCINVSMISQSRKNAIEANVYMGPVCMLYVCHNPGQPPKKEKKIHFSETLPLQAAFLIVGCSRSFPEARLFFHCF